MGFVSELKRRNVFRMAALYVVAAWLIMQVAEVLKDLANLPDWVGPVILALLGIGLPIALILSWFYELTPEGISLDADVDRIEAVTQVTGRRVDFIIIAMLAAAVILFAVDKWWPSGPIDQSIAVLAFENMSDDPGQEYFSDGISEELLNALAKFPELSVTSRSSAFSFKGKDVSIPEIAARLNVAYVLEGSVRKAGDQVRITAQLIEAETDSHIWSDTYDRRLDDIFAVQGEIAAAIADMLKLKMAARGGDKQALTSRTAGVKAYDLYLHGVEMLRTRDAEEAAEFLRRSVDFDNSFAPAHAQLAIALLLERGGPGEAANRHLEIAEELEPGLAETHAARALQALFNEDPEAAVVHARNSLELNPSSTDAMNWLNKALESLGRYKEAYAVVEQMMDKDPLSILSRNNYRLMLATTGRLDESRRLCDQLIAENYDMGRVEHARRSLWYEGDIDEGLKWAFKAAAPVYVWVAFAMVGEYDEARRFLHGYDYWIDIAQGHWDRALEITLENLQQEPDNMEHMVYAAAALYGSGRIEEAAALYERLYMPTPDAPMTFDSARSGPIQEPIPVIRLIRMAQGRRMAGDEAGARAAIEFARRGHEILLDAGHRNQNRFTAAAMFAAFEGRKADAITALKQAIGWGMRVRAALDDPIFDTVRDEPGFGDLEKELDAIIEAEHAEVLQLVCFNNPVPQHWRPLPETCEDVVEQPAS